MSGGGVRFKGMRVEGGVGSEGEIPLVYGEAGVGYPCVGYEFVEAMKLLRNESVDSDV